MKVYVGYHIWDYADAICMSTNRKKVEEKLIKMFGANFDINECFICEYNLNSNSVIEFE